MDRSIYFCAEIYILSPPLIFGTQRVKSHQHRTVQMCGAGPGGDGGWDASHDVNSSQLPAWVMILHCWPVEHVRRQHICCKAGEHVSTRLQFNSPLTETTQSGSPHLHLYLADVFIQSDLQLYTLMGYIAWSFCVERPLPPPPRTFLLWGTHAHHCITVPYAGYTSQVHATCAHTIKAHIEPAPNATFCRGTVTVIDCDFERNWEWFMSRMENGSAICYSTCNLSAAFFPPLKQRNLIKFIFDLLNGSHESDRKERRETKAEKAEKTLPSGCFLISASGSTGSRAGPLWVSQCCIG